MKLFLLEIAIIYQLMTRNSIWCEYSVCACSICCQWEREKMNYSHWDKTTRHRKKIIFFAFIFVWKWFWARAVCIDVFAVKLFAWCVVQTWNNNQVTKILQNNESTSQRTWNCIIKYMNQLTGIFYHTDFQWTTSGKSCIIKITKSGMRKI